MAKTLSIEIKINVLVLYLVTISFPEAYTLILLFSYVCGMHVCV